MGVWIAVIEVNLLLLLLEQQKDLIMINIKVIQDRILIKYWQGLLLQEELDYYDYHTYYSYVFRMYIK